MLKHMEFSIPNYLCFAWIALEMCLHGAVILHSVRLVHMVVHCENMYHVQLLSQILF